MRDSNAKGCVSQAFHVFVWVPKGFATALTYGGAFEAAPSGRAQTEANRTRIETSLCWLPLITARRSGLIR